MPVERLTPNSKFKIDVSYWEKQGRNFRSEVYDSLCDGCKNLYSLDERRMVDHVDPETGEIIRMDALLDCASELCAQDTAYIDPRMPLTRSIFRAFIAAGNLPQSAQDIFNRIKKGSPQVILKELLSVQMENEGIIVV